MTLVWVKIWVKPSNFRFLERDRVFADSPRRTKAPWSCSAYRCNYVRPHDQICAFFVIRRDPARHRSAVFQAFATRPVTYRLFTVQGLAKTSGPIRRRFWRSARRVRLLVMRGTQTGSRGRLLHAKQNYDIPRFMQFANFECSRIA